MPVEGSTVNNTVYLARTSRTADTAEARDQVETNAVSPTHLRVPVGTPLAEIERQAIHSTLDLCEGNKRRCAEMLGVSLKTLYNRLAEYQSAPAVI